ncbi:MAG TPA: CoA-binding protein [Acidimicrobiales bacterium]|nr:CoA-binding protein [Acidimicrobiales bacterium]
MPSRAVIDEFLAQSHIAFVGVSREPKQFANAIYRELRDGGRALYPVNRSEGTPTIEGDLAYRRLGDVPDPVDGVVVMVSHDAEADVVREAIARGIPRIWVHRATGRDPVSDEVRSMCEAAGAQLVDGACPLMFLEPVRGLHRLHRSIAHKRFAA